MARLIFYYTNHGNTPEHDPKWKPSCESRNPYVDLVTTEGYFYLLKRLHDQGFVDEVIIFIESNRSPGYFRHGDIQGYTVPHIKDSKQFLQKGDIIWARGGFRSWHDFLIELQNDGHWLMVYAANTGRERWPFWDIILDDLNPVERFDARGRFWAHFKKPMNDSIFYPQEETKIYDVCIGASHIHDKKGQYKALNALEYLNRHFDSQVDSVLPGSKRGGVHTRKWLDHYALGKIRVYAPGMLPRTELARTMNQSKMFIYLGGAGQGDRGPLEAMACGAPLLIGPTSRLAPSVYNNPKVTFLTANADNPSTVAQDILKVLQYVDDTPNIQTICREHYEKENGINVAVKTFAQHLYFFKDNPVQNKEKLKRYAESRIA